MVRGSADDGWGGRLIRDGAGVIGWARMGRGTPETTSLPPSTTKNRSENSQTQLKTGRGVSFSDLSPTVNAQPGV